MSKKKPPKKDDRPAEKVVCRNRKARYEYHILDTIEAGIVLKGTEVKSLRTGQASLEESYARVEAGEVWLLKCEIPEYEMGNRMNHDPKRKRKLLMHRSQIGKFAQGTTERGFTMIPLKLYFRGGRAKVELAIVKGKKVYDKRETMKERTAKREIAREVHSRRSRG